MKKTIQQRGFLKLPYWMALTYVATGVMALAANVNRNVNVNRNAARANVNRNVNVNQNVNVHRDVNVDVDYHDNYHPVATAAAVTAAATVTAAVVGSIVQAPPPASQTVVVGGATYIQSGNTWYQPQYSGTQVSYVVVNPPR